MKIISIYKSAFLSIIMLIAICCKNSGDKSIKGTKSNSGYSKIEIYCWCFLDTSFIDNKDGTIIAQMRSCETLVRLNPSDLIESKSLFYSTSNKSIIETLQELIFDKKEGTQPLNDGIDSRFLILFKKDDLKADTIVKYHNFNKLWYNGQYLFNYFFNIIDSIRSILNVKKIDCKTY